MTLREAIKRANEIRPNTIDDSLKASWLFQLEGDLAETMDAEMPENPFPEDCTMLMPYPHDECYELYLSAMIDNANQETTLYNNDILVANASINSAKAWWRRNHNPTKQKRVKL